MRIPMIVVQINLQHSEAAWYDLLYFMENEAIYVDNTSAASEDLYYSLPPRRDFTIILLSNFNSCDLTIVALERNYNGDPGISVSTV